MTWLYWPHCITVYEMFLWINEILTFLVLFLIWCLLLRACSCWLKKKKPKKKKKRLFIKSDLISSMYVYSRFTVKDCSSSQFSGSRLQSQHTTIFQHITIHRQQKKVLDHGVTKMSPPPPHPSPNSLFKYSVWANIFKHFSRIRCMLVYLRRFAPGQ